MSTPLRVLLVEDSENDAALVLLNLRDGGYAPVHQRVDTPKAMNTALAEEAWDVVISDYVMPCFSGLDALQLLKAKGLDLPFIIVSGHIGEDIAVAAMKAGAHDYVMKDRLARLVPAVERELREAEVRRAQRQSEEKLKAEHAFRQAIEKSIPSGIAVADLQGRLAYVNPAFCAMVGWSESDLVGARYPFVYWPPEDTAVIQEAMEQMMNEGRKPLRFELRFRRRNEERFHALVLTTPLLGNAGVISGWLASVTDITVRKQAEEALRQAHAQLERRVQERTAELAAAYADLQRAVGERKRLEVELLEITDKERRRIGRELHDDLGQKLAGVALMMKGLEVKLAKKRSPEATDAKTLHAVVHDTMNHAQDLVRDLTAVELEGNDLPRALNGLAAHVKSLASVSCRFQSRGSIPALPPNMVGQFYKIAQEAVSNALKHGKATHVSLSLAATRRKLVLTISNDGKPFPAALAAKRQGMGLRLMNYRANLIGASLDVKARRPKGTLVTCSLPLDSATASPE